MTCILKLSKYINKNKQGRRRDFQLITSSNKKEMIRKLKNILHKESGPLQQQPEPLNSIEFSNNTPNAFRNEDPSSPVNFIKRSK